MSHRRKVGSPLNIPFIDDSSGVMANGVVIGRPMTPPVIRITIPETEVYEPPVTYRTVPDKNAEPEKNEKPENEADGNSAGEDETDSLLPENKKAEISKTGVGMPLTTRHRRNSISLPAGLNNLDIQVISENANGDTDETFSEADESEYNTDAEEVKAPARSARKKSVMPKKSPVVDSDLEALEHSPGNSITSINSISSLLKEKLSMVALPSLLKVKKKPKNYKLKAFVCILFLCIVFLVAFAHVFYHQQVLQRAYFERIRFNNEEKIVRMYDNDGEELLSGYLGTTINSNLVFKCLKRDEYNDGSVCMEWMHRARLYLRFRSPHPGVRCYQITWQSLNYYVNPTDCFDWSRGGHWYGGGQVQNMTWPAQLGIIKLSPFITGDIAHQQWGNVLQRYFLNSKGVSISVDQETPLYVALDTFSNEKRFCLQARYDNFVYYYHNTVLPVLNYSICTSNNIKILHGYMSEKSLWDGLKEKDIETIYSLLTEPVWQIGPDRAEQLTESAVYNYTEDVIALAFLRQGHVLINEIWQENIGDFTVDEKRFPTMMDTIKILQRRGFKIVFTIQPFISTESHNFKSAMKEKLLVTERSSAGIPALTKYKGLESAGMLDITNNQSIPWIQERLLAVVKKYNINSFYLDLGSTYNMPHFYRFEKKLVNPDQYKTLFTEAVLQLVEVIGVSSAVQRPKPPVFVSLPPMSSTWESLTLIIPIVLTYGIIGYPFIMPGPVGGDYYNDAQLANYTYMYIKSVENALLHKSINSFINKSKTEHESKATTTEKVQEEPKAKEEKALTETQLEEDFESEELTSEIPKEPEKKEEPPEQQEPENVFSTNYDNFFNKNINPSMAADIVKNISATTKTNILEKASEAFPGDVMLSDQPPEFVFLPDKELYIRWLQLATFLPVIRFTHLPSKYKDESVLEIAKILTHLRVKTVNPLLKKYAKEALDSGLPIIRPLWMLDPSDPTCHTVVDEFSVGEELIVAPVIHVGTTEREVYLPAGVWKDGIDGSLRKGSRWIHKYKVMQDKIAYFVKMPDNTRF
ncbi:hypothetical protein RUM44_006083 [Polyplax serrata]|uniref:Myogenesis-regulating glycosidase n=1 Tax=Polyplax serrata TaxID=468196 RepID=A0ABR1AYW6_POLSC